MNFEQMQELAPTEDSVMEEHTLQGIIRDEISSAAGREDDLSADRSSASNYYFCKPNGTEVCGRSQVVDSSVADSIEAVMAQIMPIFANDNIVSFDSVAPQDEAQSKIESRACSDIIMNKANGYKMFQDSIHNALLYRNGINKVEDIDDVSIVIKEYEGLPPQQYQMLLQPQGPNEEVNVTSEEMIETPQGPMINATIMRRTTTVKVVAKSIHPRNFVFSSDQEDMDLSNCSFTADVSYPRRYELVEAGFSEEIINQLPRAGGDSTYDAEDIPNTQNNISSSTKETDSVEFWQCTIRVDYDMDGYAELRKICTGGPAHEILSNDPCECVPYAAGSPFPVPGRFIGQSFFDKLKDTQDSKTSVQRQYWDNLNANNNRRLAVDIKGISEPDSLLDSKPAGIVKCKRPPMDVIMPIPVDDIGPSCINALDYLDRQRSEKVGASLDMQTQQMQVSNDTAHGAERMISAKEEMSAYILSNLFNTLVRNTYLLVHKKLRIVNQDLMFKDEEQWKATNTGMWLEREQISIDVGLSKGMKASKIAELTQVYGIQQELNTNGKSGILVDDNKIFNTLSSITAISGTGHTDSFWVNPQSEQAQQTNQQNSEQQQEMKQKEDEVHQVSVKLQTSISEAELLKAQNGQYKNEIEQLKAALDARDKSDNLQFDYDEMYEDNATKLAIADVQAKKQVAAKSGMNG